MKKIVLLACSVTLALGFTGCAGTKPKSTSERGWIGGSYMLAKHSTFMVRMARPVGVTTTLPKSVEQSAAIQVIGLMTNAPAYAAGLRKGDFVLALNQKPVTSLEAFRRIIDRSAPGSSVGMTVYRDGQDLDFQVPVGREKYRRGGYFSIAVPTVVHRWDLWPNPGFSLVCVGYEPNPGLRHDFGPGPNPTKELYDEGYSVYLVFMEFSVGRRVTAQEPADKLN